MKRAIHGTTVVLGFALLLCGCAHLEAHLAKEGCRIDGPLTFTCPWELR